MSATRAHALSILEADRDSLIKRFRQLFTVSDNEECWAWNVAQKRHKYPGTSYRGKYASAHRLSYAIFIGPIPRGVLVMHLCDNTICVNPSHLMLGTDKDNALDMVRKGRRKGPDKYLAEKRARTHCPNGHEFNEKNTAKAHRGRACRACQKESYRRYHPVKIKEPKTHCISGHEFTKENTRFEKNRSRTRICITCARAKVRAHRERVRSSNENHR